MLPLATRWPPSLLRATQRAVLHPMLHATLRAACLLLLVVAARGQEQPPTDPAAPQSGPTSPPTPQPALPSPEAAPASSDERAKLPVRSQEVRVDRPATVNGEAITADEIIEEASRLAADYPGADAAQLQHVARAMIAGQILLAAEAKRLGVTLPERDLDEYWERTAGRVPDYAALAAQAGISVERQIERARRTALADLYLRHRIGLRGDYGRWIAPDPRLVRLVTVTPAQMRDAFQENRKLLDRPERVVCDLYQCEDATAADAAKALIAAGGTPPGQPPARRELPVDALDPSMPPELVTFLRDGAIGSLTTAPTDKGVLVVAITAREPAVPAEFVEAQEQLRLMMLRERMEMARRELIETLRKQATYWPGDLFDA